MAKRSGGFPGMGGNMNQLMKQAQKMQKQMEETTKALEESTYEATAGGGVVKVVVSGKKEVVSVHLEEEVVDPDDVEMLEDLVLSAINEALKKADEVLQQAVQGITDLINLPALINLDFADVSTVMKDKGLAHIGIGSAKGDDKAIEAVKLAVASPLLETTINGATHVIINISGDISLMDANDAASYVQDLAGDDANIIFGAKFDESMTDEATITVIATGLETAGANAASKIVPKMQYQNMGTVPRPTAPVTPRPAAQAGYTTPVQPNPAPTFSGIQKPRQPESSVQQMDIKIPDFLKNSRR